ncbi:hypothetical protein [Pseudomonas sp. EA_35y_Pfl2_R5]|uniref:hypothetical protein n=1 Tax=Pseudomonas sp. EA_35y_Pfl2_R5 TaxID=3088690 RepID=UPI0030D89794
MKISARQRIDRKELTPELVHKALRAAFPKKNDFSPSETRYEEELSELIHFGVLCVRDLRGLLNKHRKRILEIDRSPMDQVHQRMYAKEMGIEKFNDFLRRQYWFAYPGLLRLALELEFGDAYEAFANARDGI